MQWQNAFNEISQRLNSTEENLLISGLLALKNILKTLEYDIEEERKPLFHLVEYFFPHIERLLPVIQQSNSGNQIELMILVAKIFFIANSVRANSLIVIVGDQSLPPDQLEDRHVGGLLQVDSGDQPGTVVRDSD